MSHKTKNIQLPIKLKDKWSLLRSLKSKRLQAIEDNIKARIEWLSNKNTYDVKVPYNDGTKEWFAYIDTRMKWDRLDLDVENLSVKIHHEGSNFYDELYQDSSDSEESETEYKETTSRLKEVETELNPIIVNDLF
jgi:hypothetical protein